MADNNAHDFGVWAAMREKLSRRLEALEKARATAGLPGPNEDHGAAFDEICAILSANNFHQEPNESVAGAFARFLGISLRELRTWLIEGHPRPGFAG
jgi:hypothetical protein